jgi:uncharacterized protein YjiS (DUF1127 family)
MGILNKIVKKIQDAQERRVAMWQLHNLSDAELRDIGIGRSQIWDIVNNGRNV